MIYLGCRRGSSSWGGGGGHGFGLIRRASGVLDEPVWRADGSAGGRSFTQWVAAVTNVMNLIDGWMAWRPIASIAA